jgi:hypothetical protein
VICFFKHLFLFLNSLSELINLKLPLFLQSSHLLYHLPLAALRPPHLFHRLTHLCPQLSNLPLILLPQCIPLTLNHRHVRLPLRLLMFEQLLHIRESFQVLVHLRLFKVEVTSQFLVVCEQGVVGLLDLGEGVVYLVHTKGDLLHSVLVEGTFLGELQVLLG